MERHKNIRKTNGLSLERWKDLKKQNLNQKHNMCQRQFSFYSLDNTKMTESGLLCTHHPTPGSEISFREIDFRDLYT